MQFLQAIGYFFLKFLSATGRFILFTLRAISHSVRPPFYPQQIIKQLFHIGYLSLPVVGLTAIFTGMVLALQSYTGFSRFSAEGSVATVVIL
ncbi:MAG: ABC transporter permease, partial [Alphaproteobacteria bacterium]|nr:ABC transporter permease [Alphaproteobacteria bacterium]